MNLQSLLDRKSFIVLLFVAISLVPCHSVLSQQTNGEARPKKVLLLHQSPDGHPQSTHEYLAGQRILAELLKPYSELDVSLVSADSPWSEGPDLLREADVVVLFVSEGARWMNEDERRYQAFAELAERETGIIALHWAMGTREAENIEPFLRVVGGCHGGPDRRHAVFETILEPAETEHVIASGLEPIEVKEEFYFQLKFVEPREQIIPVMTARIEGANETVAWSWERPGGGRSFGFSGLHFHENWGQEVYRQLVVQAVLWSAKIDIPEDGVSVELDESLLHLDSSN